MLVCYRLPKLRIIGCLDICSENMLCYQKLSTRLGRMGWSRSNWEILSNKSFLHLIRDKKFFGDFSLKFSTVCVLKKLWSIDLYIFFEKTAYECIIFKERIISPQFVAQNKNLIAKRKMKSFLMCFFCALNALSI